MSTSRIARHGGTLLIALAIPVSAAFAQSQFAQLAATDDGKCLYFGSQLLLRGGVQNLQWPETRLYRFGPGGVTLFAERGDLAPQSTGSSSDGASNPQVSGDGLLIGYTLWDICPQAGACDDDGSATPITSEAMLKGSQNLDLGPGALSLSRNGRWALLTAASDPGNGPAVTSVLIDLQTGARIPGPYPVMTGSQMDTAVPPASDGTVLAYRQDAGGGRQPGLWKQGQFVPLQFPPGVDYSPVWLSADASTLVSTTSMAGPNPPYPMGLVATNLATGRNTLLYQAPDTGHYPIFIAASNNGQVVLFRVELPNWSGSVTDLANAATGQTAPIPLPSGELAGDGTLTGGGDIAFLATSAGRIVKVAVATGAVTTLFPAAPVCDAPWPPVAGSLVLLRNCTFSGAAADLQGKLEYNDTPMAIVYSRPGEIAAQVPWQVNFYFDTLYINTSVDTPFQAALSIKAAYMAPLFLAADPGQTSWLGLKLVKSDWSGLVTAQPKTGDIFYAYMTGLGDVATAVPYGTPASSTIPDPITANLQCQLRPQGAVPEVLFAGLAPGMIGIYQVAFRMPATTGDAPVAGLACAGSFVVGGL